MSWLTEATSPWWSAPVASLATLVVGNFFSHRSTEKEREANAVESAAERTQAATLAEAERTQAAALAEKQHRLTLEGEATTRAAFEERIRNEMRLDACTKALDAIAVLRTSTTSSAALHNDSDEAKPLSPHLVSEFISAISRARLMLANSPVDATAVIADLHEYVHEFDTATAEWRVGSAEQIDDALSVVAEQILAAYQQASQ